MSMKTCPKCGSDKIDSGQIVSAGVVEYRSDQARSPFNSGKCKASACLDCGYVEMYANSIYLQKIKDLMKKQA